MLLAEESWVAMLVEQDGDVQDGVQAAESAALQGGFDQRSSDLKASRP